MNLPVFFNRGFQVGVDAARVWGEMDEIRRVGGGAVWRPVNWVTWSMREDATLTCDTDELLVQRGVTHQALVDLSRRLGTIRVDGKLAIGPEAPATPWKEGLTTRPTKSY